MTTPSIVFLLSPAHCGGPRARMLLESRTSRLAARLGAEGAPLGEVFTFLSSLYFRGKLAYANAFGAPPNGWKGSLVIAPGRGLVAAEVVIRAADLRGMGEVPVDPGNRSYREPLIRDAGLLERALGSNGRAVLLGSVATEKYAGPLIEVFGDRLLFPRDFVGRGDMSRGGLLLRSVRAGTEIEYVPVLGALRRGPRAPRLALMTRKGDAAYLPPAKTKTPKSRRQK